MSLIKDTRRPIEKIIAATMLLAFCFGLSSIISATPVSATNTFTINIDNSIALRVLDKTGETAITTFALPLAAAPRGAFTSDYFNIEVSSANAFGYRLFMSTDYQAGSPTAYTTDLVNTEDNSVSIPTLSTKGVAKSDFSRPSGSYVNSWGYSLDNTTFNPAPDHTTSQVIKFQKEEINRDLVPVYIGANVDSSKISGVYRNVLTFSAIGNLPATGYTLYFDAGTTDPVDNLPATMTAEEQSATHTFTIPSTAPTREGYAFTGYRDIETGTLYQAGDTITVAGNEQFVGSAELSAEWEVGCTAGANRICYISNEPSGTVSGTMEDQTIVYMTSTTAANTVDQTALSGSTTELTLYSPNWTLSGYGFKGWNTKADGTGTMYGPNQTITLTSDQKAALGAGGMRLYAQWVQSAGDMASWSGCSSLAQDSVTALTYEGDTYAVAKLADGKCWMIENLRYDSESTSTATTGTGQKTTSFSTSSYTLRQYNVTNISGSNPSPTYNGSTAVQWKSYGGYYSWASAIGDSSAHETPYMNPDTATESRQGICPSGWRLPRSYTGDSTTNNANSDFRNLNNELNGSWTTVSTAAASNNWRKYPNNFVFAGFWTDTSSNIRGTTGFYWSSTVYHSLYAYGLRFTSAAAYPVSYDNKFDGLSVRCIIGS
ncbi:InlB B-repeat-containing protein [Candidatus Saccharibacteria bacterium]|nr:InlB B-repeat-containing protein [Candidatus Saccharibacteria bacterium]